MPICHASIVAPPSAFRKLLVLCFYVAAFVLSGCTDDDSGAAKVASPGTYFPVLIGEASLSVQLALTQSEQQRGLMFRESLGPDEGMLFLFPKPDRRGFWMKNTSLPLDIGYFDSLGRLVEVHPLFPYDETTIPSSSSDILIAVETNRGWFKRNGASPGDRIDFGLLREAIKQRGATHALTSEK